MVPSGDRGEPVEAEPRPRRGEGGGKPAPRLGGLGGSEIEKERKFGRGSEQKKFRKTEGDLHADPMGRRIQGESGGGGSWMLWQCGS